MTNIEGLGTSAAFLAILFAGLLFGEWNSANRYPLGDARLLLYWVIAWGAFSLGKLIGEAQL